MQEPRRLTIPLAHVTAYLGLSVVWVLALSVLFAIGLLATGGMGAALGSDPLQAFGARGLGALSVLQMLGLCGVAVALGSLLPATADHLWASPWPLAAAGRRIASGFGFRRSPPALLAAAGLGALTMWTFPSWAAEQLVTLVPEGYTSSLEALTAMMRDGDLGDRLVLGAAIVISAPLLEELVFRGYLWRALELGGPAWLTIAVSTVLFAAYHMDPVHVLSILPTAFFLGWLRHASGSIWPPMLAHFVNNGLAAVLTTLPADWQDRISLSLPVALAGLAWTTVCCVAAWAWTRRQS